MEIEITYDDYLNSCQNFMDSERCPLATAMKRILANDNIEVGTYSIYDKKLDKEIGRLTTPFGIDNYDELKYNQTTFKTTYTENEEVTEPASSL